MARVSIGLPVRNGGSFVAQAISSLLAQTFTDFELIIADNASTDDTEETCRAFAARDRRIRYVRHEQNQGAAHNFNFVFHQASGEYFKWAAHDDLLEPEYLERCVEVLDRQPDVVLCHAHTDLIDSVGAPMGSFRIPMRVDSRLPWQRFHDLAVVRHDCVLVFGLIRREVLARTPLIASYVGSDRVLLCELALHGRFHEVPQRLFHRRDHAGCSSWLTPREELVAWYDPRRACAVTYPNWRILRETISAVHRVPQGRVDRLGCYLALPAHLRERAPRLGEDLLEGLKLHVRRSLGSRVYYTIKRAFRPR